MKVRIAALAIAPLVLLAGCAPAPSIPLLEMRDSCDRVAQVLREASITNGNLHSEQFVTAAKKIEDTLSGSDTESKLALIPLATALRTIAQGTPDTAAKDTEALTTALLNASKKCTAAGSDAFRVA